MIAHCYLVIVYIPSYVGIDSGVHAISQCCAMKLLLPSSLDSGSSNHKEWFIQRLNQFLPDDIRAHTMTKVSKAFNAKLHCSKRKYYYLVPSYALQSAAEMSELLETQYRLQGPVKGGGHEGGYVDSRSVSSLTSDSLRSVRERIKSYRASPESIAALRDVLKLYEGNQAINLLDDGWLMCLNELWFNPFTTTCLTQLYPFIHLYIHSSIHPSLKGRRRIITSPRTNIPTTWMLSGSSSRSAATIHGSMSGRGWSGCCCPS